MLIFQGRYWERLLATPDKADVGNKYLSVVEAVMEYKSGPVDFYGSGKGN